MKTKSNILRVALTLFVLTLSTATLYALCKTAEKPTTAQEQTTIATTSCMPSTNTNTDPKTSSSSTTTTSAAMPATGTINGHEWVDLGLSVKWATCNIGASSPGDYGNYYAWGEVRPKTEYTSQNSITSMRNTGNISGNPAFDAARANWGGSWRLPTSSEVNELMSRCTRTSSMQGDHFGYIFTGPNGNSIFLPAAGFYMGVELCNAGINGDYWTGTPAYNDYGYFNACILSFSTGITSYNMLNRQYGLVIRPVTN